MHNVNQLHFVGIGGAGMNGIAEVLLNQGYSISGSDIGENNAVMRLRQIGVKLFIGHAADNVLNADVVIVSTAITEDNIEVLTAKKHNIPVIRRAEMLAELMRFKFGIAVGGTHGKTTTTSLIASVLAKGDLDPTYVIGGVLNSSGCNAKLGASQYFVAEADESDASFLHLQPMMAVVTNIDFDHMETYEANPDKLYQTFIDFLHQLPFYGLAVLCNDDAGVQKIIDRCGRKVITFGFNSGADIQATHLQQQGLQTLFNLTINGQEPIPMMINLPGKHNVLNALAACAVATELGIDSLALKTALAEFKGVGRRAEVLGNFSVEQKKVTLIDDYGHHPNEVRATLTAICNAFPERRVVTIFQPHRYSRTRDCFEDFSNVLSEADVLLLLDIYAAGEVPIPSITGRTLAQSIRQRGKASPIFVDEEQCLASTLLSILQDGDVVLMLGAGTIGKLAQQLKATLSSMHCESTHSL